MEAKSTGASPNFEARRESVNSWGFQPAENFASQKVDDDDDFDFGGEKPPEGKSPDEKGEDWKKVDDWKAQLNSMTSGVDNLLKDKKDKLDQIKVDSYYQRKKTQDEINEDAVVPRPKTLVGKRKKKWTDLDDGEFEEIDGEAPIFLSDTEDVASDEEEVKEQTKESTPEEEPAPEEELKERQKEKEEEKEDIFSTEFVNETLAVLDVKLAEIPDSPEPEEDDIFDTKYADVIVKKAERERKAFEKAEDNKIKFGCISNAADVLSGKVKAVDKSNVQHAIKPRSRRANRINLIADEVQNVTATDETPGVKSDLLEIDGEGCLSGDLLTATTSVSASESVSPVPPSTENNKELQLSDDLKEFDVINKEEAVAEVVESEEEDPFDAAFDEIARDKLAKFEEKDQLAQLEEDLFNDDLFDTTGADDVLNLASLTKVKDKKDEVVVLDNFEDKDPFDTTAYEHLTKDLEEDLEFESLANRDPNYEGNVATEIGKRQSGKQFWLWYKAC